MNLAFDMKCIRADPQAGICELDSTFASSLSSVPIGFTPAVGFTLTANNSKRIGNIVNINFSGTVTGDIGGSILPIGNISGSFPLIDIPVVVGCVPTGGVIVAQIHPTGVVETCPTGFPFPIGSYTINFNTTYIL